MHSRVKKTRRSLLSRIAHALSRPFRVLWRLAKGKRTNGAMVRLFLLSGLAAVFACGIFGLGALAYISRDLPDPDKLIDRQIAQSTKIYDRTGETLLYEIAGEQKRTIIKLEDLPDYVAQSVIALEDKTFYEHSGFNFQRLVKAILLKSIGRRGPGASTLTSQLVKNAILSPERTLTRKAKEMILTWQIERKFSKEEILQLYLNEIPYGSTAYGIEAASNYYFDKSAKDLTLAEAATMAAIIQLPTRYSPYGSHLDELLNRKNLALRLMQEQGFITEEEKTEAQAQELAFRERREQITAPHFVFYVRDLLVEKYGEHLVNRGGLVVKTTLDLEKQGFAEEVITARVEPNKQYEASNAALVSLDANTGEILAMVGSIDYFNDEIDGQVNVALRPRQPGSSFKPIVYTLAWQRGYTPSTVVFDVNTDFPGSGSLYKPKNYDLKERGPVSLRTALQGSLNIPAVKMLYLLGVGNVLDFADNLGYTTFADRSRFGLSLVLGGGEVTLLDHTAAYATLAADGMYHEPMALLEVKTNDGHVLDEFKPKETRVIESNIARITSNVLSDNEARAYVFGLSSGLTLPGRPAAAKTGTTNDYRDAWTMGYVPQLATGVWVGNNDFSEMKRGGGSSLAAPIWQGYMTKALQGVEAESFGQANIPVPDKAILSGQGFGVQQVSIDRASGKLATDLTPLSFREEKLYVDAHDILYYVDKRNPTGPAPTDPAATDSQFNVWENAAQAWMAARLEKGENIFEFAKDITFPPDLEIVYGLAPTEMDDVHVEANKPSISIESPFNDTRLDRRSVHVSTQSSSPRGISRVEFYLDNTLLGTDASAPFEIDASLKSFPNGFYTLSAIAFDDVDNSAETNLRVQLQSDESFVDVSWESPKANAQINPDDVSVPLRVNINSTDTINQVTFFAVNRATNEEILVEAIVSPLSNRVRATWVPTKPGLYRLYTRISVNEAGVLTGPSLNVEVLPPPPLEEGQAPA